MQYGDLCKNCKGVDKCKEKPTETIPWQLDCIYCKGRGCDKCKNKGYSDITCCPLEMLGKEMWDLIDLFELYEKGLPPIAGGTLDQAKSFLKAFEFFRNEKAKIKQKME